MEGAIEFIAVAFRFALAALFLIAGFSKLGLRAQFGQALRGYGLLPSNTVRLVAAGLPPAEIAAGLLLGAGVAIPAVATGLFVLLGVFTLAVAINLARGRRIDCGCFGPGVPRAITWTTVARNVGLATMAATVVLATPRALSVDGLLFGEVGTTSHSSALAALIASIATLTAFGLAVTATRLGASIRTIGEVTA